MADIYIYDTTLNNSDEAVRGGGRVLQALTETLPDAKKTAHLHEVPYESILLIPSWQPYKKPSITRRYAKKQILIIFDVIPLLYKNHFPAGFFGWFKLWRSKRVLRFFDTYITISRYSKKTICEKLGLMQDHVQVVYPAVSKTFMTTTTETSDTDLQHLVDAYHIPSKKYCVYVGDVNWNKNLVNIARAIKKANIPCVFVGKQFTPERGRDLLTTKNVDPWLMPYKEFLHFASGDPLFVFVGHIPDEDLKKLYHYAVCNVLASYSEGFGYSYVEAASQQTPSVLSDIEVFHEVAGNAALFAHPDKPDAIASAIVHLAENSHMRHDLALSAYAQYETRSHPEGFASQLATIFV